METQIILAYNGLALDRAAGRPGVELGESLEDWLREHG